MSLLLIQIVLSSIPIYFLLLFRIHVKLTNSLERLIWNFLWERVEEGKRPCLVNWEVVVRPLECGGPRIGNLKTLNELIGCGVSLGSLILCGRRFLWVNMGPIPWSGFQRGFWRGFREVLPKFRGKLLLKGSFFFLSVCSFFGEWWAEYLFIGK